MAKYRRKPEIVEVRESDQGLWRHYVRFRPPQGGVVQMLRSEFERLYESVPEPKIELPPCVCRNEYCYECNPGNFK